MSDEIIINDKYTKYIFRGERVFMIVDGKEIPLNKSRKAMKKIVKEMEKNGQYVSMSTIPTIEGDM